MNYVSFILGYDKPVRDRKHDITVSPRSEAHGCLFEQSLHLFGEKNLLDKPLS